MALFNTVFNQTQRLFDREYSKQSRVTLWPATIEKLGGIIVGDHLTVEEDGTLSVDFASLFKSYSSKYEFPNIGEPNYFYIDESTGDIYLWGIEGFHFTSVGIANHDTIYGGSSEEV